MSKTKAIANDIAGNSNTQKFIFRIFISSFICLCLVYVYIIGSITFNVVARKSLEKEAQSLGSDISQLELTYLSSINDVNKAKAISLGFVETKSNIFAIRSINYVALR